MNASPSTPTLQFAPEKRLSSGDRVWILTDTYMEWHSFRSDSTPRKWFKVGCFDLKTNKICYVRFSLDDARGLLRAGFSPPPWTAPLSTGIEVTRLAHDAVREGRFKVEIREVNVPADVVSLAPVARAMFARDGHWANSTLGMWKDLEARVSLEKEIEATALRMSDWFSAGDLKKKLGKPVNVTPVLTQLVQEKRLLPKGKKRGAKYLVTPPEIVERVDWTG